MLKYQLYSPSQIVQISSVNALVKTYPIIQRAQSTLDIVSVNFINYDAQSLLLMSQVMKNTHKVLDWISSQINQTVSTFYYLNPTSLACIDIANQCSLVSIGATGSQTVSMGIAASNAFSILKNWDVVQNYDTPNNPDILGMTMLIGLSNL